MKLIHKKENKKVVPLKRFGQNYLNDKNILLKIVDEINPLINDNIIEVGPGFGSLTRLLINKVNLLTSVEIDKGVSEILKKDLPNLNLIVDDFLKLDLNNFYTQNKIRVVGNIPYNITAPIIFKLIDNIEIINDAVFLVQYEVAQRMIAAKGTKEYSILSVLLNAFGSVKLCFKVSPNVFYPKPKVNSAVVHIYFNKNNLINDKIFFISVVKSCFSSRRKILKNSLSNGIFTAVNFNNCPIDLTLRAEQLLLNDFILLSNFIFERFNKNI